jgi:two-component SAPR family response regulator
VRSFTIFVDRGIVTRDEIFQSFWPELPEREATNIFHVTKRKVHALLGFNLMVYQNGYYCIAPEIDLRYDVSLFLTQIQQSEVAETEEAIALLENAVRLYRKDFLVGLNAEWVNARRAALRNQLAEAFGALGQLYERVERHIQAISAYERALAIQPHREDWARPLMNLYIVYRQARRGIAVFERLESALQRQAGKVRLDKRTQELVAKLRRLR